MREVTRHLCHYAKPLHATPIAELDRRRIAALLDDLADDSGAATANRVRASLSSFFSWCIGSGYREQNPVTYTPKRPESPRQRVPSLGELRAIWSVLGDDPYSSIVKLLLLTGLRRAEIGDLAWHEVDLEAASILLSAGRVKGKRQHIVPLSAAALRLLEAQPHTPRHHLFGQGSKARGFQSWPRGKAELDAKLGAAGHHLEPWTLHDLRRSFSTLMSEQLCERPEIIEACLGHVVAGTRGIYMRSTFIEERRRALERWAALLAGAVPEGRVVRLPRRRQEA